MKRGPKTKEGKNKVRQNALKHALTARLLHLSREEAKRFEELKHALHQELAPVGTLEQIAVDDIAVSFWRYMHALQWETTLFQRVLDQAGHNAVEEAPGVPPKREIDYKLKLLGRAREVLGLGLTDEVRSELRADDEEFLELLEFEGADPKALMNLMIYQDMETKSDMYPGLANPMALEKKEFVRTFPGVSEPMLQKIASAVGAYLVHQMQQKLISQKEGYLISLWGLAQKQKLLQDQPGSGIDSATRYISSIRKALYQAMSVFKTLKESRQTG